MCELNHPKFSSALAYEFQPDYILSKFENKLNRGAEIKSTRSEARRADDPRGKESSPKPRIASGLVVGLPVNNLQTVIRFLLE
jgi:hypothetical protein